MFEQALRYPCPSCKEIITDRDAECRYCGAPVDKGVAAALAEVQSRVNQAYSDANFMKTTAFAMWGFLAASLVPFVPFVYHGFLFTFVAVIAMIIRWQLRFSRLNTSDADYAKARRWKNLSLALWAAALPAGFVVRPLVATTFAEMFS